MFQKNGGFFIIVVISLILASSSVVLWNYFLPQSELSRTQNNVLEQVLQADNAEESLDLAIKETFGNHSKSDWLIRLAYFQAEKEPKLAIAFLDEAIEQEPQNTDFYLHKAEIYENQNLISKAIETYKKAHFFDHDNLAIKEKMGELYVKNNEIQKALEIYSDHLNASSDSIWLKIIFLSKIYKPVPFDLKIENIPPGKFRPIIKKLLETDSTQYLTNSIETDFIKDQAIYWLTVLEALRKDQTEIAYQILTNYNFGNESWNPRLEHMLKNIICHQKDGVCLNQENVTDLTNEIVLSTEAFAIACLVCGWNEAALKLHVLDVYPDNFPEWAAQKMAYAIKQNRGIYEAISFASHQAVNRSLGIAIEEFLVESEKNKLQLDTLNQICAKYGNLSSQAAWLASNIYLEQNEYEKAKQVIVSNNILSNETRGKELLARILFYQNEETEAEKIYESIEKSSPEAKSFLARKAFSQGNLQKAAQLIQELIQIYPENMSLKENLQKIIKAQETH